MLGLALLVATAQAQDVFFQVHDLVEGPFINPLVVDDLVAAGSTGVEEATTVPKDLSGYRVVILNAGASTAPAPVYDTAQLQAFVADGGWVVINGDHAGFTVHNERFNEVLDALGSSMRLAETSPDNQCGIIANLGNPYHRLMAGVTAVNYASQAEVVPAAGPKLMADVLVSSFLDEALVAVEGRIVLTGDTNLFSATCEVATGNRRLVVNMWETSGGCLDADGDGFEPVECGGEDCDDGDRTIFPGALEVWYDGVDQDCSGGSDYDRDGDKFESDLHGGTDCDDHDPDTYQGAPEIWYDGVDQDCMGGSDYDRDGDGFLGGEDGDDCDDVNRTINPAAFDIPGDGIDQDCDGVDATTGGGGGGSDSSGCASGGTAPAGGLLLLGLLGLVRRRR